ncbi:acyl-CoA thioesterase [Saccharicrinis sp. FJH54]|uniref:acyl-CoA thioesterase n=1 Tax=Saccharicrinis sp. FJH54 TaxID=3344665 RepID=UPI0035D3E7E8
MIHGEIRLRPRYGEVDQMGYVYHANYVSYCHEARTELLRQHGVNDFVLEKNNIMIPVIDFRISYKKPARYDEVLTISTKVTQFPEVRMGFEFEIRNENNDLICMADSTIVFVSKKTRQPVRLPEFIEVRLKPLFSQLV